MRILHQEAENSVGHHSIYFRRRSANLSLPLYSVLWSISYFHNRFQGSSDVFHIFFNAPSRTFLDDAFQRGLLCVYNFVRRLQKRSLLVSRGEAVLNKGIHGVTHRERWDGGFAFKRIDFPFHRAGHCVSLVSFVLSSYEV